MLDNVVNFYYGYVQIHQKGYWEDQTIDNSFELTPGLDRLQQEIPLIREVTPRLESFALASNKNQTIGMLVVGTEPERENTLTNLADKLTSGEYLSGDDRQVLLSEGAARQLGITTGDTLVLISQGYHGVNAAGKYPVKGLIHFTSPELNKKMIYLPLKEAMYFFGAPGRATSLGLKLDNRNDIPAVKKKLAQTLPEGEFDVLDWKEMLPELVEAQKTDAAGNYIFLIVLYVLITFGIFGTILMMTKERQYEFGVLLSIGMRRGLLAFTTWLEIVLLGLTGALLGILASIPLVYYFHIHPLDFGGMEESVSDIYEKWGFDPVMPTAFEFDLFFYQALTVFILTSVLAAYTIRKIYRLKPVEAMRQ